MLAPESPLYLGKALPPEVAGQDAPQGIYRRRGRDLGLHWHEQVQVVGIAVKLAERRNPSGWIRPPAQARPCSLFHADTLIARDHPVRWNAGSFLGLPAAKGRRS